MKNIVESVNVKVDETLHHKLESKDDDSDLDGSYGINEEDTESGLERSNNKTLARYVQRDYSKSQILGDKDNGVDVGASMVANHLASQILFYFWREFFFTNVLVCLSYLIVQKSYWNN